MFATRVMRLQTSLFSTLFATRGVKTSLFCTYKVRGGGFGRCVVQNRKCTLHATDFHSGTLNATDFAQRTYQPYRFSTTHSKSDHFPVQTIAYCDTKRATGST
jgi:hypothetical protein